MQTKLCVALLCLLISACAIQNAPSIEESIAAGYISVETLAESVLVASQSGKISDEDRATAKVILQQAKNGLDMATSFIADGNDVNAASHVAQAYTYFETVRRLLREDL